MHDVLVMLCWLWHIGSNISVATGTLIAAYRLYHISLGIVAVSCSDNTDNFFESIDIDVLVGTCYNDSYDVPGMIMCLPHIDCHI